MLPLNQSPYTCQDYIKHNTPLVTCPFLCSRPARPGIRWRR